MGFRKYCFRKQKRLETNFEISGRPWFLAHEAEFPLSTEVVHLEERGFDPSDQAVAASEYISDCIEGEILTIWCLWIENYGWYKTKLLKLQYVYT